MLSVSVALATFNSARFIEEQVVSILTQGLLPAEVVLSDDGSTDGTVELVRDLFARANTTVRLVVLTGGGLGTTANFERAVGACTSDLVALCDHDDVWHENRLSAAVGYFETDAELLLQHSDARLVDAAGSPLATTLFEALEVSNAEVHAVQAGRAFEVLLHRNLATGATVVFRRTLLAAALPFAPRWVHDEWLAILAAATGTVQLLQQQLIDYRQHGANQIGVTKPTLAYKVRRVFEPQAERRRDLAERSRLLVERLVEIGAPEQMVGLARQKAAFELRRASISRWRVARIPFVLRSLVDGSYRQFASQRSRDALRDVLSRG